MIAEAIDIVQPNVLSVGGYTEAIKVAHMAGLLSGAAGTYTLDCPA